MFYLPEESRWSAIQQHAKQADIALRIDTALSTIKKKNPSLKGALPDNYFSHLELDVSKLAALIDTINKIDTITEVRSVVLVGLDSTVQWRSISNGHLDFHQLRHGMEKFSPIFLKKNFVLWLSTINSLRVMTAFSVRKCPEHDVQSIILYNRHRMMISFILIAVFANITRDNYIEI